MEWSEREVKALYQIVQKGFQDSSEALSMMTTGGIELREPHLQFMPMTGVPNLAGGPGSVVVGVYLAIEGDLSGHMILLFDHGGACRVVDMLMGDPIGTAKELDEIAISALAETGNVCGTSLLNALANSTGMRVLPTAPLVITDMAGAILQSVVTEISGDSDTVLVIETGFNSEVPGHFLLLPDQPSMARLAAALGAKA